MEKSQEKIELMTENDVDKIILVFIFYNYRVKEHENENN